MSELDPMEVAGNQNYSSCRAVLQWPPSRPLPSATSPPALPPPLTSPPAAGRRGGPSSKRPTISFRSLSLSQARLPMLSPVWMSPSQKDKANSSSTGSQPPPPPRPPPSPRLRPSSQCTALQPPPPSADLQTDN